MSAEHARRILKRAARLVAAPADWLQHEPYAGHLYEQCKGPPSKFCSQSAIEKAASLECLPEYVDEAKEVFRDVIGEENIPNWNDDEERAHVEIVRAFDVSIARAIS